MKGSAPDSHGQPAGQAAGQQVSLLPTLRALVRDYPPGVGIIKEFLQNADDAGASWLKVTLDLRTHLGEGLPPRMRPLLGPALIIESDQTFKDGDLEAIRRIGEGSKSQDVVRTGQFGKGFNTAYTVTDYPGFATRHLIRCFDPFDDAVADPGEHGRQWSLSDLWPVWPEWPRAFGVPEGTNSIGHTIFRLPLRQQAQTGPNRLSMKPFTPQEVRLVFEEVEAFGTALMLFTRSVLHLTITERDEHGSERVLLQFHTQNERQVLEARGRLALLEQADCAQLLETWRAAPHLRPSEVYQHDLVRTGGTGSGTESWVVGQGYEIDGAGQIMDAAEQMLATGQQAVPRVGLAIRLEETPSGLSPAPCVGHIFCTLPLPDPSGLPFHVNAFVALDTSRTSPMHGRTVGDAAVQSEWNSALLSKAVPAMARRVLAGLLRRDAKLDADKFYAVWPSIPELRSDFLNPMGRGVLEVLASLPSIRVRQGDTCRWHKPAEVVLAAAAWSARLLEALASDGLALPEPVIPARVLQGLKDINQEPRRYRPDEVSAWLSAQPFSPCHFETAPLRCLREKEHVRALFAFVLNEIPGCLTGLPLSLRRDGTLKAFDTHVGLASVWGLHRLIPQRQEWCLDESLERLLASKNCKYDGTLVVLENQLAWVLKFVFQYSPPGSPWTSAGEENLDLDWMQRVLHHLAGHPPPDPRTALASLPLAMEQTGQLRPLFDDLTPTPPPQQSLTAAEKAAFDSFGVPVLGGPQELQSITIHLNKRLKGTALPTMTEAIAQALLRLAGPPSSEQAERLHLLLARLAEAHALEPVPMRLLKPLASLKVWPIEGGALRALDEPDTYWPTGFKPADLGGRVELFRNISATGYPKLLKDLGARPYDLEHFVRGLFIDDFPNLSEPEKFIALSWLAEGRHTTTLQTLESRLWQQLQNAPLAPCLDGTWVATTLVYHADAEEAVKLLAGRARVLRAPEKGSKTAWTALFTSLGVGREPRPEDLLHRLQDLVREAAIRGATHIDEALHLWVDHVAKNWASWKDQVIQGRAFHEHLKELAWVPVLFGDDAAARYGPLAKHSGALQRTVDVYALDLAPLVASQAPVCSLEKPASLRSMLKDLGVKQQVPLSIAIKQFRAIQSSWASQEVGPDTVALVAASVYAHIGRVAKDQTETLRLNQLVTHARSLQAEESIWVADAQRFFQPAHVFNVNSVDLFCGLRAQENTAGSVGAGLDWLGRRGSPTAEDYVSYLKDLAQLGTGQPLQGDQLASVLQVLRELNAELGREVNLSLGELRLPDRNLHLVSARLVLEDDAPWWRQRLANGTVRLVHEQVPRSVAERAGVQGVSLCLREELVDTPQESGASDTYALSESFQRKIGDPIFQHGLRRLAFHAGADPDADLEAALKLKFRSAIRLQTALIGSPSEPNRRFGLQDVDVFLDEATVWLALADRDAVLPDVAVAIQRRLHHLPELNPAALEELLRIPSKDIERALDRRRIRSLPNPEVPAVEPAFEVPIGPDDLDTDQPIPAVQGSAAPGWGPGAAHRAVPSRTTSRGDSTRPASEPKDTTDKASFDGSFELTNTGPASRPDSSGMPERPFRGGNLGGGGRSGEWHNVEGGGSVPEHARPGDGRARRRFRLRGGVRLRTFANAAVRVDIGSGAASDGHPAHSELVERNAIRNALAYEARAGVAVEQLQEMPPGHPGYDLERRGDAGEVLRYIEVKGVAGAWDRRGVALRPAQVEAARTHGERYWVYVVEFALEAERAQVFAIPNPVLRLQELVLDDGWRKFAEPPPGSLRYPQAGLHLLEGETHLGEIVEVSGDPADSTLPTQLKLRRPDGTEREIRWSRTRHTLRQEV